jgi:hypothetical protein
MDRKFALATAAAVVLTVSAGTAAVAANLGLLSSTVDDTVGQLQPARDEQPPNRNRTIVIEEVVPAPTSTAGDDRSDGEQGGDLYDDDLYDDDLYDDDDHEDEEDEDEEEDDDGHDDDD